MFKPLKCGVLHDFKSSNLVNLKTIFSQEKTEWTAQESLACKLRFAKPI